MAHGDLSVMHKALSRLLTPQSCAVVHIDARCYDDGHRLCALGDVTLCPHRYRVDWGEISMVDTVNDMVRQALSQYRARHYVLMSGNDYPVKTSADIERRLDMNPDSDFIMARRLPSASLHWLEDGARRLKAYALPLGNRHIATIEPHALDCGNMRELAKTIIYNPLRIGKALQLWAKAPVRIPPVAMHGGEFWWILTRTTLLRCLDYIDSHPDYHRFMSDVSNPDEVYYHTLVALLSPDTIVDKRMRYIYWTGKKNSPAWLTRENYDILHKAVANPDALLARKIGDTAVCDLIDSIVGGEVNGY